MVVGGHVENKTAKQNISKGRNHTDHKMCTSDLVVLWLIAWDYFSHL